MNKIISDLLVLRATEAVGGNRFLYEGDKGKNILHRDTGGTAERGAKLRTLVFRADALQNAFDPILGLRRVEGLGDIVINSGPHRGDDIFF